jgi:hypothetical protein
VNATPTGRRSGASHVADTKSCDFLTPVPRRSPPPPSSLASTTHYGLIVLLPSLFPGPAACRVSHALHARSFCRWMNLQHLPLSTLTDIITVVPGRTIHARLSELQSAQVCRSHSRLFVSRACQPGNRASRSGEGSSGLRCRLAYHAPALIGPVSRFAHKDRRPIDPPPIVQLHLYQVFHQGTEQESQQEITDLECRITRRCHACRSWLTHSSTGTPRCTDTCAMSTFSARHRRMSLKVLRPSGAGTNAFRHRRLMVSRSPSYGVALMELPHNCRSRCTSTP